jgi:hypothetical protein
VGWDPGLKNGLQQSHLLWAEVTSKKRQLAGSLSLFSLKR